MQFEKAFQSSILINKTLIGFKASIPVFKNVFYEVI